MCTKVYAVDEGAVTSGCYRQTYDGYDIELCVCESATGGYKPCNGGVSYPVSINLVLISVMLSYLLKLFNYI